jgi:hypothetical protein
MSSAILYLAIIAIWLCVLVPRWLKRDSARGAVVVSDATAAPDGTTVTTPASAPITAPVTAADGDGETVLDDGAEPGDEHEVAASGAAPPLVPSSPPVASPAPAAPLSAAEARRRIMAGRRRLLGMLIALEIAAIALAVLGLAAIWVVIPPSIMLIGYLLLLREAAHADAERAQREAEATAPARERARARARAAAQAAQRATAAEGTGIESTPIEEDTAAVAAAIAAKFAAAPVPADHEEAGRDFAPGLAGKYTTSNAGHRPDAEDYSYEEPRLRAVGD